ncbi:hypothetical protein F0562_003922 [Nyssa sinensis]|uniref:Uncharacterized protein n=1 Tax=Nyssa sinensis TaxID=561372 RepID=A0A5J5BWH6_9ASTE|nr:hypothetical protein F0562_003921 [Nyssa sinensis]KAA8547493.1 hypothetical protein F0562_003922 [Nyssa sinensis]
MNKGSKIQTLLLLGIVLLPSLVMGECTCELEEGDNNKHEALKYKGAAIASILVACAIGVCIPMLGKIIPALQPDKDLFFVIKAFAAGVILATGFVLELGIVVHSVIIGISLGASESPKTIKPLIVALTFHQFFEGIGLGGCISQAKFKPSAVAVMALFFCLTTPVGIVIGIGITNVYKENSPTALIVEGILNAASAGILIYMALVDLLAADFMNAKMQNNRMLQLGANVSLLIGAALMSLLAKWA